MARSRSWNRSASPRSCSNSATCGHTWCSATTGRGSHAPTMRWNAASAGSRCVTAASAVARIGTAICCVMGALLPTPSGGNRMQSGGNNWSSTSAGSIAPAGESFVARPPSHNGSNSRAFVSVTSARPFSSRSRSAGLPLLRRDFCLHGKKTVIERAYVTAERLGLALWCQDEGGPYQYIPQPGSSFQSEGDPARRPHEYLRGGTAKLLTLFRPATGEVRAQAVEQSTNAILHPWLKRELQAILKQCSPAPLEVPQGRRWQDWDIYPAAEQLDRFFPPVRVLLILDNLAGHKSYSLVQWCAEHGILLLWTPHAGSWLNMAESVQRIIKGRALAGQDYASVQALKQALTNAVEGWNRHPTPFTWGGKRHARRDRAYARRHRLGGSGATTTYAVPRRIPSVRYYKRAA